MMPDHQDLEAELNGATWWPWVRAVVPARGSVDHGDGLLRPCTEAAGEVVSDGEGDTASA